MYFLSPRELAESWQVSERYIRKLCKEGRIEGAKRRGGRWQLPLGCVKPKDMRAKAFSAEDLQSKPFAEVDFWLQKVHRRRPFEADEQAIVDAKFLEKFTYECMTYAGYTVTPELCRAVAVQGSAVADVSFVLQLEIMLFARAWEHLSCLAIFAKKRKSLLCTKLLLEIYAILKRWNGLYSMDFRSRNRFFIGDTRFFPSRGREVRGDLKKLFDSYSKNDAHPIKRIAEFYLAFETIQPFEKANGRIGMLMLNFELKKAGYPPIVIKYSEKERLYAAYVSYREGHGSGEMQKLIAEHILARLKLFDRALAQNDWKS